MLCSADRQDPRGHGGGALKKQQQKLPYKKKYSFFFAGEKIVDFQCKIQSFSTAKLFQNLKIFSAEAPITQSCLHASAPQAKNLSFWEAIWLICSANIYRF